MHTFSTKWIILGLDFTVTIIVARLLGPEGRGIFVLASTLANSLVQFGILGQHNSLTYLGARNREGVPALAGNGLLLLFLVTLVCSTGLLLVRGFFPGILPVDGLLFWAVLAAVPLLLSEMVFQGLLLGLQDVYWANRLEVIGKTGRIVVILLVVGAGMINPTAIFIASVSVSGIVGLLFISRALAIVPGRFRLDQRLLSETLQYGFKAYLAALFGFLVLRSDLLMINYFMGANATGVYSIAATLISVVYILPTAIGQMAFVHLVGTRDKAARFDFVLRVTLLVAVVILPILVIGGLLSRWAIPIMFGEAYSEALAPFQILLIGVFVWSLETVARKLYTSDGYALWIVGAWAVALIVNVGLNALLIPNYGIEGAAWASVAGLGVVSVTTLSVATRDLLHHRRVIN